MMALGRPLATSRPDHQCDLTSRKWCNFSISKSISSDRKVELSESWMNGLDFGRLKGTLLRSFLGWAPSVEAENPNRNLSTIVFVDAVEFQLLLQRALYQAETYWLVRERIRLGHLFR
jgi:hypothetical protein